MAAAEPAAGWKKYLVLRIMLRHPELCCIVLAGIFTVFFKYGHSIKNARTITQSQPGPRRFFPISSAVIDSPLGALQPLSELVHQEEVLFVMYYAPWCAQSMEARWEFEKAARYFHRQVTFAAVNCWWPLGQCANIHDFHAFPVFFFYHTHLEGFPYLGLRTVEHMIAFLERFLYPLTYVTTQDQVKALKIHSDNVVLSFFDFNASPQPPGLVQFYYASMRMIAVSMEHIPFAVITDPVLATDNGLANSSSFHLLRSLNETVIYPDSGNISSSQLVSWIVKHKQSPAIQWVSSMGMKTLTLSTEMKKGAGIFVFTTLNPLGGFNQYINMIREVALDYYNCDNSSKVRDIIHGSIHHRWRSVQEETQQQETCKTLFNIKTSGSDDPAKSKCCQSVVIDDQGIGSKNHNVCDVCVNYWTSYNRYKHCRVLPMSSLSLNRPKRPLQINMCQESMLHYDINQRMSLCCSELLTERTAKAAPSVNFKRTRKPTDAFTLNAAQREKEKLCNRRKLNRLLKYTYKSHKSLMNDSFIQHSFTGQSCRTNRTLRFFAVDDKYHAVFASRLGIRLDKTHNGVAVVLVDIKNEAQYVMTSAVSKRNLVEFIESYTHSELMRVLRTSTVVSECGTSEEHSCVIELTAKTFHQVVMEQNQDVVVFYYTHWCGFCAGVLHLYLTVARYFRDVTDLVFTRVNADSNDLPWEFTVTTFPTILFFPAGRKEDSVHFPDHLAKSVPNLINFVLQHASKSLKVRAALELCSGSCIQSNKHNTAEAIKTLQREVTFLSSKTLKITHRLGQLKHMQTLLKREFDHVTGDQKEELIVKNGTLCNKIGVLEKYLDILKQRRKRKETQSVCAKDLYKVLSTSRSSHLERYRLVSLLTKYELLRQKVLGETVKVEKKTSRMEDGQSYVMRDQF
ncbi:thioredoxin domain-containing protein 11 [Lingula anatina]|uniref:Thioredoxin domain-containing protein 11 n=1 Tax=Lingula anatina TaxID=7574 RepID=A0A1S3IJJ9_LINAN|nr:thioredoxin domain-containing protein 11 [Lingula anatina]|eukprot:XP_013398415.1 thioredoxin domain-containing protein 11 [Lingula anatina]